MQQTEQIIVSIIPEMVSSELEIINDFRWDEFLRGTTGLGLPIVKKIIDAHQGSINITENHETGVTFIVTIPWK